MKHLKLFENSSEKWSLSKVEELYDDMEQMGKLIFEYLTFNNFVKPKDKEYYHYHFEEFWLDEEEDIFFSVLYKHTQYKNPEEIRYDFTKNQFDDLMGYMNDPETYKNSKNYNI